MEVIFGTWEQIVETRGQDFMGREVHIVVLDSPDDATWEYKANPTPEEQDEEVDRLVDEMNELAPHISFVNRLFEDRQIAAAERFS